MPKNGAFLLIPGRSQKTFEKHCALKVGFCISIQVKLNKSIIFPKKFWNVENSKKDSVQFDREKLAPNRSSIFVVLF